MHSCDNSGKGECETEEGISGLREFGISGKSKKDIHPHTWSSNACSYLPSISEASTSINTAGKNKINN